jgi:hypothetical protein
MFFSFLPLITPKIPYSYGLRRNLGKIYKVVGSRHIFVKFDTYANLTTMRNLNHYKEKFWDYSNDELKDIVAGRFSTPSDEEVAAAVALLRERRNTPQNNLSIAQLPDATMSVLLEVIKNPHIWGEEMVVAAEQEILYREQQPSKDSNNNSTKKTFFQVILAILGVIASVIIIKTIAAVFLIIFLIYSLRSCIDSL